MSLSGMRIGPIDPKNKVPKVGARQQYAVEEPGFEAVANFLNKERSGFSGGFKIPQEQRVNKLGRKIRHIDGEELSDFEEQDKNAINKDDILQDLELGSSSAAAGSSKHGTGSKSALTKDLMENLEKELEKLRRTEENIKVRKHIAKGGDRRILDETEEQKKQARDQAVYDQMRDEGNEVIAGTESRI